VCLFHIIIEALWHEVITCWGTFKEFHDRHYTFGAEGHVMLFYQCDRLLAIYRYPKMKFVTIELRRSERTTGTEKDSTETKMKNRSPCIKDYGLSCIK
jgi:hypothetical protein